MSLDLTSALHTLNDPGQLSFPAGEGVHAASVPRGSAPERGQKTGFCLSACWGHEGNGQVHPDRGLLSSWETRTDWECGVVRRT